MAYWRLHYHLIWATYKREPMLNRDRERMAYGTLYQKAKELGCIIHGAGNTEDHFHVVVSIPPKISVSDCVRHFKGASSHAINKMPNSQSNFKWQEGYGAISIGEKSLPTVSAYANNQKQHHAQGTAVESLKRMTEEDDGVVIQSA